MARGHVNQTVLDDAVIAVLEERWWHLNPGEDGYDQPLYEFCGLTREQWEDEQHRRQVLPVGSGSR